MPHEPLTGDALLDALSEVPGDPAEPVPATVPMRRRDYKLTPEDIAVVKDRQRREAEANPIFPPGGLTWRPHPDAVKPPTAPYHGKSLWGWAPNADIPHVVSVPIEAALADLRARLPDDPWSAQYQGTVSDPPATEPELFGGLMVRSPSDIAEQAIRDLLNHVKRDADSPVAMVRKICPELRDRVPTQIVQNPYTIEPGHALDDAARRSVEARKSESLLPPTPRVITWEPVPLAITSWRVFINPTEEENPE